MLPASISQHIKQQLAPYVERQEEIFSISAVGGGSINSCYRVQTSGDKLFFCKLNDVKRFPGLFKTESEGLQLLGSQNIIRVPKILSCAEHGPYQILLMEWIEQGTKTVKFWEAFGEQLASMHAITWQLNDSRAFGLGYDNYMGALIQRNRVTNSWIDFFIQRRLQPQIELAFGKGLLSKSQVTAFEKLYKKLPDVFDDNQSSLLHGDLWSGNFLCGDANEPVLIDPAVYYGHRSMDLAMTTLFGGFDKIFYDSYSHSSPLPANYRQQWDVCNLYPLLIHVNLFGGNYMHDVQAILRSFA